jgi:predicted kinase
MVKKVGVIMVGVSGSGKSTYIAGLEKEFPDEKMVTFSLDKCRLDMWVCAHFGGEIPDDVYRAAFDYATANQKMFDEFVSTSWEWALKADVVVVDNTNLTRKSRARWIQDMRKHGFVIVGYEMLTPLQVVLDRQDTRGDKAVPKSVVRDMYMRQQSLLLGSEVDVLHIVDGVTGNRIMF